MFDNIKRVNFNRIFDSRENLVIEPAVVDHCNLNCAYCDHMSPLAPEGFYDVKQFDKDMNALSKILTSDYILNRYRLVIQLVGGEPFLHPKLLDFADIVFKYIPVELLNSFIIITNGTMFHKRLDLSEHYKELLRKYGKPGICISKYPDVEESFIRRTYFEFLGTNFISLEPRDTFSKVNLDFEHRDLSGYCCNGCMCLRDGKLFKCPVSGNVQFLMKKLNSNFEVIKPEDYLDLSKPLTPEEFVNFHTTPRNFCYYCKPRDEFLPWRRSEKDPKEWLKLN